MRNGFYNTSLYLDQVYNVSFRRHFSKPPFVIQHITNTLFDRCLHQTRVR